MSWWRPKEQPDKEILDWRRFNDHLAPIVQAELDRGNALVPPGRWEEKYNIDGRGARAYRLHLRYQLDTEAIDAEFILPEGIATRPTPPARKPSAPGGGHGKTDHRPECRSPSTPATSSSSPPRTKGMSRDQ